MRNDDNGQSPDNLKTRQAMMTYDLMGIKNLLLWPLIKMFLHSNHLKHFPNKFRQQHPGFYWKVFIIRGGTRGTCSTSVMMRIYNFIFEEPFQNNVRLSLLLFPYYHHSLRRMGCYFLIPWESWVYLCAFIHIRSAVMAWLGD